MEIRGLSKVFRRGSFNIPALENVDLAVQQGEFLCLMGPSGSGKTTLLNIIAGIDRPTSGELKMLGEDVSRMDEDRLAGWRNVHVGFVFQTFNLFPVFTAFENVELPLLLTRLSGEERNKHVISALALVGLAGRLDHYPCQLSGGQEQRVAIARALVSDPTLLVCDEPAGGALCQYDAAPRKRPAAAQRRVGFYSIAARAEGHGPWRQDCTLTVIPTEAGHHRPSFDRMTPKGATK